MHHSNDVRLLADVRLVGLVVASLGYAGITALGFIQLRAGKHNRTTGRAFMLFGVGNIAMIVSNAISRPTWLREAVFWTGFLVIMCAVVVGVTAARRRNYDRERALDTTTRY
jgi:hypothetical protein